MRPDLSYTMTEAARILIEPAHRLIYLCEKGVVVPDVDEAGGRGSSRRFSARNLLEFAIVLRLRDALLPVEAASAVLHLMGALEREIGKTEPGFTLPEGLRRDGAPELVAIIRDGSELLCTLGPPGKRPRTFGPVDLGRSAAKRRAGSQAPRLKLVRSAEGGGTSDGALVRVEINVTRIARSLELPPAR